MTQQQNRTVSRRGFDVFRRLVLNEHYNQRAAALVYSRCMSATDVI